MPLHGIFYARFLPQLGTKIVAQSPPGCIVPVALADDDEARDKGKAREVKDLRYSKEKERRDSRDNDDSSSDEDELPSMGGGGGGGPSHSAGPSLSKTTTNTTVNTAIGPGSGVGSSGTLMPRGKPLLDFDVMQEYVIPRAALFNRYVAAREPSGRYTVLGLPVAIVDGKYDRNEFIFNFGIVVDAGDDQGPYAQVVRRLASTFREMELQNEYLSRQEKGGQSGGHGLGLGGQGQWSQRRGARGMPMTTGGGSTTTAADDLRDRHFRRTIQSLLEIVREDLNLYGECMIPIDDANTINMKLFPQHVDPPVVESWHVPVPKMRLADAMDASWDLTLQRVVAHMDGVADVRRIAFEADVSLELCKKAVRHLLYYDTVLLLDLFFFGSCYAPTSTMHDFVANVGGIVEECARYVCLPANTTTTTTSSSTTTPTLANYDLINLMTSFCVGRTVTEWLQIHAEVGLDVLRFVDVRRLVQFGVIKGCLYRVHKYVVSKQYLASLVTGQSAPLPASDPRHDPLQRYTDGNHHFDQLMTEQNLTEVEVLQQLKKLPGGVGDLKMLYR